MNHDEGVANVDPFEDCWAELEVKNQVTGVKDVPSVAAVSIFQAVTENEKVNVTLSVLLNLFTVPNRAILIMNLHEEDPSTSRSQKLLCPECLSKIHSFVQKPSTRVEMHETALARLRSGSTVSTDTDKQATDAFIDEVKLDLVSYDTVIDELENKLVELKRARSASSHHLATGKSIGFPRLEGFTGNMDGNFFKLRQ
ncbi:hypothetical protein BT96DRAFT_951722 [Gymnopus androsaceus JB14]|uniref:Uncharacterized protein n=1 Tax=Gymnopus androsaceus JB14 TaxID=1447944 RepID=A0A6A4GBY7_9AGAR|nr:hypothetical protein BT96DRAFT_951722 [Gymnopus androsaceus JB14]